MHAVPAKTEDAAMALRANAITNGQDAAAPLLEIDGLTVQFETEDGPFTAVDDLSFRIAPGETVAVVGESGSGKSVTSLSLTRLIDYSGGRLRQGAIRFRTRDGRVLDLGCAATRSP